MACLEHNNRPPCNKPHSKPKLGNEKRTIAYLLTHNEMPNYNIKDQHDYKSIKTEQLDLI